ncbi:FadR/GntR family transcriptional regulator [Amycolatopsis pithecellobii]|uniref:GntR family transcriptional regulator n=1 Tax=Amycolatopsis pithecellobii TaxID=664692 RepID=A0A6N7YWH8_9PSEU|nr:GntR family transcriptional regulator [Amycolatopsis pithecellobii]MTD57447.1 GntR family transcriptional regulator [Amycolatopsis pithecellobii]
MRAADQIVADLVDTIGSGALPLGSRLPTERDLAQRYGVSGPTVREAIRAVAAIGLVEVRHGSGTYIAPNLHGILRRPLLALIRFNDLGSADLAPLFDPLCDYLAMQAIEHGTLTEIDRLHAVTERAELADDGNQVTAVDLELLRLVLDTTHHAVLVELCGFLVESLVPTQVAAVSGRPPRTWRSWLAARRRTRAGLLAAYSARDPEQLAGCVRALVLGD